MVFWFFVIYEDGCDEVLEGYIYFIGELEISFVIIFIGIDLFMFFYFFYGFFMLGVNVVDIFWKKFGVNFWSKREIICNLEIFESNG